MVVPQVQFIEFDSETDPSGYRNIPLSGKVLDTSITGYLDFGDVTTSTSGVLSDTKMIIFRVSDLGDASGVYNLRFFLNSTSAFNTGSYRFLYRISTDYLGSSFQLGLSDSDIPTTQPLSQNLLSTSGTPVLSGIEDGHVSQYIYLAVYAGTDIPYGSYGGGGAGSFRFRCIYDFS